MHFPLKSERVSDPRTAQLLFFNSVDLTRCNAHGKPLYATAQLEKWRDKLREMLNHAPYGIPTATSADNRLRREILRRITTTT